MNARGLSGLPPYRLMTEDDHAKRWEREVYAVRAAMVRHCQWTGVDPS
ncbi:MAG: hypothetical protein K0T01_2415, partial [Acidimicrobiia bacterium]|nr:hypothetical protein [Acidimicrobiia bacterium]